MDTNQNLLNNDLQIDSIAHTHLKEAAGWARFIGIVGIVLSILFTIVAFFAASIMKNYRPADRSSTATAELGAGVLTVIYLVFGVICFLISFYLHRFGARMKQALQASDQTSLNLAFQNIKVYLRILGIITILYIGLIVLGLIVTMIAGVAKNV